MMKSLSFLVLLSALFSVPVYAEDSPAISDNSVREFYKKTTDVMFGNFDGYAQYVQSSLTEDFNAQMKITIHAPGQNPAVSTENINKKKMLEMAQENFVSAQGAQLQNEVLEILKDPNGKKVAVKDKTTARGLIVPVPAGAQPLYMDGDGVCHDLLVLSDNNELQIAKSFCNFSYTIKQER